MGKGFQDFREYRGELTEAELAEIKATEEKVRGSFEQDGIYSDADVGESNPHYKEVTADGVSYINEFGAPIYKAEYIGYHDLASERVGEILQDTSGLPLQMQDESIPVGVDPYGKNSWEEVALAQRFEVIKNSVAMQHDEIRDLINVLDKGSVLEEPKDKQFLSTYLLYNDMHRTSGNLKYYDVLSKVCQNETLSEHYEGERNKKAQDIATSSYAKLLSCVEYASGLSDTLPETLEVDEKVNQILIELELDKKRLSQMNQMAQNYDTTKTPLEQVTFRLVDAEILAMQHHMSMPATFGKAIEEAPKDFENQEVADKIVNQSLNQSAANALNPLYHRFEKNHPEINRAKLIIVAGKTVEEIMKEEHLRASMEREDIPEFPEYFAQNYQKDTNRIVAAAMLADKRVETFIPDANGKIAEPVQMIRDGGEPTPLTPVIQNTWHKVMSRFGFYKDELLRQDEFEKAIQKHKEVKDNVKEAQFQNVKLAGGKIERADLEYAQSMGKYVTDQQLDQLRKAQLKLTYTRGAVQSICMGRLLMEGHSLEAICDPNALQEEKRAMGTEFTNHAMNGDSRWFAETIVRGQELGMQEINHRVNTLNGLEHNVHLDVIEKAKNMIFDTYQEKDRVLPIKAETKAFMDEEAANKTDDLVNNLSSNLKLKFDEFKNATNLVNVEEASERALNNAPLTHILKGKIAGKVMDSKGGKDVPFTDKLLSPIEVGAITREFNMSDLMMDINSECSKNQETLQLVQQEVKNDTITNQFQIQVKRDRGGNLEQLSVGLNQGLLKDHMEKPAVSKVKEKDPMTRQLGK